ncbi:hypothetical protein PTE30175_01476 [Pandoraea terrae]|uniref:Uncharacterized protein n=1 Tax=Pandoraea terrae TaxID=1537710 RepID=A0A5E4TSE4_9BURK|nr:hypothetical protein PTE30175_01476 [Pandoraea terrae]
MAGFGRAAISISIAVATGLKGGQSYPHGLFRRDDTTGRKTNGAIALPVLPCTAYREIPMLLSC